MASIASPSSTPRRVATEPGLQRRPTQPIEEPPNDDLFVHPHAEIVSFIIPQAIRPGSLSGKQELVGSIPWKTNRDIVEAAGQLRLCLKSSGVPFLDCAGKINLPMMHGTQCWCVDQQSKFVIKGQQKMYRIELPYETDEDKAKVEEFKKSLSGVIRYEKAPCPFKRGVEEVEILEDSNTSPKQKIRLYGSRQDSLNSSELTDYWSKMAKRKSSSLSATVDSIDGADEGQAEVSDDENDQKHSQSTAVDEEEDSDTMPLGIRKTRSVVSPPPPVSMIVDDIEKAKTPEDEKYWASLRSASPTSASKTPKSNPYAGHKSESAEPEAGVHASGVMTTQTINDDSMAVTDTVIGFEKLSSSRQEVEEQTGKPTPSVSHVSATRSGTVEALPEQDVDEQFIMKSDDSNLDHTGSPKMNSPPNTDSSQAALRIFALPHQAEQTDKSPQDLTASTTSSSKSPFNTSGIPQTFASSENPPSAVSSASEQPFTTPEPSTVLQAPSSQNSSPTLPQSIHSNHGILPSVVGAEPEKSAAETSLGASVDIPSFADESSPAKAGSQPISALEPIQAMESPSPPSIPMPTAHSISPSSTSVLEPADPSPPLPDIPKTHNEPAPAPTTPPRKKMVRSPPSTPRFSSYGNIYDSSDDLPRLGLISQTFNLLLGPPSGLIALLMGIARRVGEATSSSRRNSRSSFASGTSGTSGHVGLGLVNKSGMPGSWRWDDSEDENDDGDDNEDGRYGEGGTTALDDDADEMDDFGVPLGNDGKAKRGRRAWGGSSVKKSHTNTETSIRQRKSISEDEID